MTMSFSFTKQSEYIKENALTNVVPVKVFTLTNA
jgi:hypothetical protein